MEALSLPVLQGVPGLSSLQVLTVELMETLFYHFGRHKATGAALMVSVETLLDCSGVR